MSARRLAILSYHKVGEPPQGGWETWYYVPQPAFHRHLGQLRSEGWTFVSADSVVAAITGEGSLPRRAALLTFDDAYRSLLEFAVPVLEEYNCPGVVFLPTDHVGGFNAFDYGASSEPREELCDWDDLRRLEDAGLAVQSHGASHRAFSDLDTDVLTAELARSKADIEQRLDRPVTLLAYPYGDIGADSRRTEELLEQAGYEAAFLYGGGPFDPSLADRFRLARIAVGRDTDLLAELAEEPG